MKMRSHTVAVCILTLVTAFAASAEAQVKRKPFKRNPAPSEPAVFKLSQYNYLSRMVELANEADEAHELWSSGDSLISTSQKSEKKTFRDFVDKMKQLDIPNCEDKLPKHVDAEAFYVRGVYSDMSEYIYLIEDGLNRMTYIQYSQRKRLILGANGLPSTMRDLDALDSLHAKAKLSKQKLQRMITIFPRYLRPDATELPDHALCKDAIL